MKTQAAPIFDGVEALVTSNERVLAGRPDARVVVAIGCFDPFQVGHARYLEAAAAHGDFLVAAVFDDVRTRALEGPGKPVVRAGDRARVLAGVRAIDAVVVTGDDDGTPILEAVKPACLVRDSGWTVETVPERDTCRRLGIEVVIAGDGGL
jgi:cytidyltransferase-like protein